ncbi:hypothetical protein ABZ468_46545 [Streptomyces sp. NPDC005708]|uniref:hypothetical protein n=1 Tax=unclassified Streptomyces TaxID=2593676 RepID=UPI0033FE9AA1
MTADGRAHVTQAAQRCRRAPRPADAGQPHPRRGGALAYLIAYDVHQAKVHGRTEPRTGIDPFLNLVTQVMGQEP